MRRSRYAGRPEVAGYNVLNEPADESGTALVGFYRRAVAAIRAVDGRHMVFLDGNRYSRDGGPYPGTTRGQYVDSNAVEAEFRSLTRYMRERDLPVWVGEFGPVCGAGPERDAQRRRLLADQIGIYDAAGAGWSLWTYKDIGVQGLVVVDPAAQWLARTEAVLAEKKAVAADHWGMTTDGMRDVLEPLLARFNREFPGYDPYPFGARRYVEELVLSICFAQPLADEFAACFADASDDEPAALAECFAFGHCIAQKDLCEVVSRLSPAGTNPVSARPPERTQGEGDHDFRCVRAHPRRPLLVRDMDGGVAGSRRFRRRGAPADAS